MTSTITARAYASAGICAPTKRCVKCGEVKPLTEFHRRAARRDGRQSYCRDCERARKRERRRERVDAGLCETCGEPAAPGRTRCADHLAAKRERVAARVAEGRCRQVGCPNDAAPGRTRCAEHLAAHSARSRAAQQARRAKGRCQWFGCPHMAEPGRSLCAEHLAANRARARAARQARVAEGRCEKAGCKNNAASGRTYCAEHLAAERERARARVASGRAAAAKRAWRERNVAQGYCKNGPGHGPTVPGTKTCARCRARDQKRYRKTLIEFTAILADQGVDHDGRCELCGLADATQVDHVRPRSRDGVDEDPLLLRWVCGTCNASRGNKLDWEPALTAWDIDESLSREEG